MGDADLLGLVFRWVHILSFVVAIGGSIFVRFALMPAANEALSEDEHNRLRDRLMPRWKKIVHACVGLLLVSGGYNFYVALANKVPPMPYHAVFGVKFLLAFAVFFFAIALTGSSPGFAGLRAQRRKWMGVQIALAVVVIVLSGLLKTFHQNALVSGGSG